MESRLLFVLLLILLFLLEILYFKIAIKFNILDKPNARSLHNKDVIRGGGIIFVFAVVLFFLLSNFQYPFFFIGFLLIASISFLDDIFMLSNKIRLPVHFASSYILLIQFGTFSNSIYFSMCFIVVVVGMINAYNFMDGINGMTGSYSIVSFACLFIVNKYKVDFINPDLFYIIFCSLIVFGYFNFRRAAKCFAGDVGSIGIGFVIIFLIAKLILVSGELKYLFFLSIYGIDSILTIVQRLWLNENIFNAHKIHLYQLLVDKLKLSHLIVSSFYMIIQLWINLIIVFIIKSNQYFLLTILLFVLCIVYIVLKKNILSLEKPFNKIS